MKAVEKSGRTVEEAIADALAELKVPRTQVAVEVLEEGNKGFLGLVGSKPARVRVQVRSGTDDKIRRAREFLAGLVERMMSPAPAMESRTDEDGNVHLTLSGRNLGLLIGRRGQTLDAVQYLVNVVANREGGEWVRIVVDAEGYRDRRAESLRGLAHRAAERAKAQGRRVALEPMSALERRVVHLALKDEEGIETHSEGEDPYRRVVIVPRGR